MYSAVYNKQLTKSDVFCYFFRIPLPKLLYHGSWNISNKQRTIAVQERFVKMKLIARQEQRLHLLDKIEARSAWFTELLSYWTIPINNTGVISALAVTKGISGNGVDDKFHVLTANPLSIFTMTRESEHIQEIPLQGLITPTRGNKPNYTIASDKNGNLIIHEATVNIDNRFFLFIYLYLFNLLFRIYYCSLFIIQKKELFDLS